MIDGIHPGAPEIKPSIGVLLRRRRPLTDTLGRATPAEVHGKLNHEIYPPELVEGMRIVVKNIEKQLPPLLQLRPEEALLYGIDIYELPNLKKAANVNLEGKTPEEQEFIGLAKYFLNKRLSAQNTTLDIA